jgi:hypothetical protein
MADIFMSYAREDIEKARKIAALLEARGWSVFWDRHIPPGEDFNTYLQKQVDTALCIVVLWSRASVASQFVRDEAAEGQDGRLVPALIETVKLPLGFRQIHTADLTEWLSNGKDQPDSIHHFLASISERLPQLLNRTNYEANLPPGDSNPQVRTVVSSANSGDSLAAQVNVDSDSTRKFATGWHIHRVPWRHLVVLLLVAVIMIIAVPVVNSLRRGGGHMAVPPPTTTTTPEPSSQVRTAPESAPSATGRQPPTTPPGGPAPSSGPRSSQSVAPKDHGAIPVGSEKSSIDPRGRVKFLNGLRGDSSISRGALKMTLHPPSPFDAALVASLDLNPDDGLCIQLVVHYELADFDGNKYQVARSHTNLCDMSPLFRNEPVTCTIRELESLTNDEDSFLGERAIIGKTVKTGAVIWGPRRNCGP